MLPEGFLCLYAAVRQHSRRKRRISRIARRTRVHQVAAAVARREDFFANAIHFFRYRDRIAAFRRRNQCQQHDHRAVPHERGQAGLIQRELHADQPRRAQEQRANRPPAPRKGQ